MKVTPQLFTTFIEKIIIELKDKYKTILSSQLIIQDFPN